MSWTFLGSLHKETIAKYVFHEMLWKKYFTVYPHLIPRIVFMQVYLVLLRRFYKNLSTCSTKTWNLVFLREGYTVKFFFQSISWNTNLTLISRCVYIKFQLNCFFTFSWNISVKEIFSFQKLKISFSEILLQRKPPHASLVLLF